ncbi:MAG: ribulose-phosphate 3-epimerase [Parcubacteria group bacterium CG10_big_fil_rev_8_21_14_0_10_36_14]|nr:MAG: ribulose-phosphate 3-epimerase [Parcubacteria group bacterium CG10_big_fil_rev_8_21_14_0_10_36_14]
MVISAILAKTKKEFLYKVKTIMPYTNFVQIDVMDGIFVPNKTWAETDEIERMKLSVEFEAHLMVKEPELIIEDWAKAGAKRIIFHIEATKKADECIRQIKKYKKEVGIAINPKTPIKKLKPFLKKINYVLVMGVDPGFSGQKFQPVTLQKIKQIKKLAPKIKIGVDGGVDQKNAKEIMKAGADFLCAASAIFKSKNIARAIENLEK